MHWQWLGFQESSESRRKRSRHGDQDMPSELEETGTFEADGELLGVHKHTVTRQAVFAAGFSIRQVNSR